ncbi:trypsin, alkaline B-like [Danaus plexippus]|uniref:trypsin, alkaline B-like n=1 Tax=Danaus plexippus TaxID=13037 RepID=UPI002AB05833|nr:trypsin, alkaline B-like [Danaus plexippus]
MAATLILLAGVLSAVAAVPNSERIAGGAITTIATYPSAASISYNRLGFGTFTFTCGGSIVSSRSILTAAFCVHGDQTYRYRVRVGSLTASSNGILHTVDYFTIHPNYNPVTKEHDIALIHVFPHLLFTSNVQLANFPDASYIPMRNQTVMAIGWGQINHGGALSESLRRVQLWLVDNNECRNRYSELEGPNVTSNMICASGYDRSGRGQCLGDNGSPLLDDRLIIGIYSWSHQCGTVRYPSVNTYIPKYANWIRSYY